MNLQTKSFSARQVADNLRESFRIVALDRPRGDVVELEGVSIASPGVAFQMFNAAFLNAEVATRAQLPARLETARRHFAARGLPWSFWFCENLLGEDARRRLSRECENHGLRIAAEMPGMIAARVKERRRELPVLETRVVEPGETLTATLEDFRRIGSECFNVPPDWFGEVFDGNPARSRFVCRVGYRDGVAVATAASMVSGGVIGIYNIATVPAARGRGYGEAITRLAIESAAARHGALPVILQSTSQGLRIYERMGFEAVMRVIVYNSR